MTSWPSFDVTLTAICAVRPPAAAVTAPFPGETARMRIDDPVLAPGVASATAPEATQATVAAMLLPSASVTVARYVEIENWLTDVGPWRSTFAAAAASTVIVTLPVRPPAVTVTVAVPTRLAVTMIVVPTEAERLTTVASFVDQTAVEGSTFAPWGGVTVSVIVCPTSGDADDAVTASALALPRSTAGV